MARPKTVKVFGGEVVLKNLPKDKQDLIVRMIENMESPERVVITEENAEQLLAAMDKAVESVVGPTDIKLVSNDLIQYNEPMTDLAIGLHKDLDGNYSLVDVNYNINTKQAIVVDVKGLGRDRTIAAGEFRVKAARKLMI